jgi:glycine dehydrogenase subunit 1
VAVYNFLPHTEADRSAMLAAIGVPNIEALFADIPPALREKLTCQHLPAQGLSELELQQTLTDLARLNTGADLACFLGGGAYARFIPPVVHTIAGRSEFYTAYTPYQPEIAQGTLQATYEFQTMICELTGMDAANASVYDGASALAEAALMALRIKRRSRVRVATTVHPDYRRVLQTYLDPLEKVNVQTFDLAAVEAASLGVSHSESVPSSVSGASSSVSIAEGDWTVPDKETACVIVQVPDYWGNLPELTAIRQFCQQSGALLVVSAEPVSLGLLQAPAAYGADIVTGDIQPLGNHLSFGGPYGGYIATRSPYVRQLPGRLVGRTRDKDGKICYTLTLQTREQHIRRETATSNICTNQALNVLKATVYLSLLGPVGLKELATLSVQRAHELARRLQQFPGVQRYGGNQPFLFEFALQFPVPVEPLLATLQKHSILGGIPLARFYPDARNTLLIACTEMTTPAQIDRYVEAVAEHLRVEQPVNSAGHSFSSAANREGASL